MSDRRLFNLSEGIPCPSVPTTAGAEGAYLQTGQNPRNSTLKLPESCHVKMQVE